MRRVCKCFGVCAVALASCLSGCALDFGWVPALGRTAPHENATRAAETAADLQAPDGLRATSGELRMVPLKWEPVLVGDVAGYVVERAPTSDGPFEVLAKIPGRLATSYLDRKTTPTSAPESTAPDAETSADAPHTIGDGVTWFYQVRAYASDGTVGARASALALATTAPPPEAPADLRAYSRQPRAVPLSWTASDDLNVVGYRVERSPTASGPFELLAKIDGRHQTTYVDRGLGDLRVFYYRVIAVNAAGGLGIATAEPVVAVTKPEPLPPIGLRTVEKRLGANRLAWEHNVEEDLVEYRLYRTLDAKQTPELIARLDADESSAVDDAVAAGQRVAYSLVAIDRDGLESAPSDPIEVVSERYGLSATVRPDGVHLEWNGREDEGFRGAHVFRTALLQNKNLGFSVESHFVDREVRAGASYRYTVVLERADQSLAPRSAPVEISIPKASPD